MWRVSGLEPAQVLLDKLPIDALRSKKRRDYELWSEIVTIYSRFKRGGREARAHNEVGIEHITQLTAQLQEGRAYTP